MKYVLREGGVESFTAGVKAPDDAFAIALRNGYRPIRVDGCVPDQSSNRAVKALMRIKWMVIGWLSGFRFKQGDIVLLPSSPGFLCRRSGAAFVRRLKAKGVKFIFLVHDIHGLRMPEGEARDRELALCLRTLKLFDALIVHNQSMRRWLREQGVPDEKMIELQLFDYLVRTPTAEEPKSSSRSGSPVICFAGNLSIRKSRWLTSVGEVKGVRWNMYGPYYDEELARQADVAYSGCFSPDELPNVLSGDYGLVWDGNSIETCDGPWGEYERYNNPHKLSLYLAAAMPVIVWSEAATAAFVKEHDVGICVSSLRELGERIRLVDDGQRAQMLRNCREMAQAVREGTYMSSALRRAEESLGRNLI